MLFLGKKWGWKQQLKERDKERERERERKSERMRVMKETIFFAFFSIRCTENKLYAD